MNRKEYFKLEIKNNRVGDFVIGMNFNEFEEKFLKSQYYYFDKIVDINAVYPSSVKYTFFESVTCWINLNTSSLEQIDLFGDYKGLFEKQVSLGKELNCIKNWS